MGAQIVTVVQTSHLMTDEKGRKEDVLFCVQTAAIGYVGSHKMWGRASASLLSSQNAVDCLSLNGFYTCCYQIVLKAWHTTWEMINYHHNLNICLYTNSFQYFPNCLDFMCLLQQNAS